MCGIIGYIGSKNTANLLIRGLQRLEYRGYDSAGLAIHNGDGTFYKAKQVGRVQELEKIVDLENALGAGIAHTRWATHGGVTVENAHPHASPCETVVLVHNGIIENFTPLKHKLTAVGHLFQSQTDSEVIAHLVANLYNGHSAFGDLDASPQTKGKPLESIRGALRFTRGTWGIAVMFADRPDEIFAARNGSPLVIGFDGPSMYLASDPHAITPHTRQVLFLNDGDLAHIYQGDAEIYRLDGGAGESNIQTLEEEWGTGEKGDFPHFMLKEIHEQPEALRQCIRGRLDFDLGTAKLGGLEIAPENMHKINQVLMLGCGTSFYASSVGATIIEALARIPSQAVIASEYRHRNPIVTPQQLYFAVTQSGETADTLGALKEIQLKGGTVMGVVNVVGSTIARTCGRGVYIHSGPEMSVASTKAFSNMVAALALFALQSARTRELSMSQGQRFARALAEVPDKVEAFLERTTEGESKIFEALDKVTRWVCESNCTIFLGRGASAHVAAEGALKLMEVAYVPCIAYPSGELKHGPIALIEEGTPVIVIAPDDDLKEKTISNLQECKARGARICLIHTEGDEIAEHGDVSIAIPKTHDLCSPFLTVLPLQLLAYKAGLALDRNIDRPRNLAKSVTVD